MVDAQEGDAMSGAKGVVQLGPLRRTGGPLNHAVYDLLKERLLEGHYAAGTRLPTDDLRLQLGVSKQPVMEALRRLSADGMIEIVPQVGCLVTGYDLHEIEDFYLGFGGFEGSIAGIAALRRTNEQLTDLDAISVQIDALRAEPDAAVRSRGYRLWPHMRRLVSVITRDCVPLSSALDHRHADHERICAALHAGDHATAREEMERHIVTTPAVIQAETDSARWSD
jgi:DNA-binding GntR family transcriptional regulator